MQATLSTDRISLRPLEPDDAVHYERLLGSDREAIFRTATLPFPCVEAAAREWISARLKPGAHLFAMVGREDGEFSGAVGIHGTPEKMELGYWVGRAHWGKGYASDSALLMVGFARELGVGLLEAFALPDNRASGRVLEKAGFERQEMVTVDLPLRGGPREIQRYLLDLILA